MLPKYSKAPILNRWFAHDCWYFHHCVQIHDLNEKNPKIFSDKQNVYTNIWNISFLIRRIVQLTQIISFFACLSRRISKCSKWRNSNFINNLPLFIYFIFHHNCWNLSMRCMYGCSFKKLNALLSSIWRTQILISGTSKIAFNQKLCVHSQNLDQDAKENRGRCWGIAF